MFTGQWADLPLKDLAEKLGEWGYDGIELACWGDHFEVDKALSQDSYVREKRDLLQAHGLECFAVSNHLVGQAVCDDPIDKRHESSLPDRIWGEGDPEKVRQRAAEEMKRTAEAASLFGVDLVNGFTGSQIWRYIYPWPPTAPETIEAGYQDFAARWTPILDHFAENGVRFALEVHPTEIAFDLVTAQRALEAVDHHPQFGFNFDPSHLIHQFIDPVAFIFEFPERIYHVHVKDSQTMLDGRNSILASHLPFGHHQRGWDFVSIGRGEVDFGGVLRALNRIGYDGPLSIEWEDNGMDREYGAQESLAYMRNISFPPSEQAFEAGFAQ